MRELSTGNRKGSRIAICMTPTPHPVRTIMSNQLTCPPVFAKSRQ